MRDKELLVSTNKEELSVIVDKKALVAADKVASARVLFFIDVSYLFSFFETI